MNHNGRRKYEAIQRKRHRVLRKFLPVGFAKLPEEQRGPELLRLAYKAYHAGVLSKDEARAVGCLL